MARPQKRRVNVRQPKNPKAAGPTPNVSIALSQLEARLTRMESAFDTNTSVFSDGMKMLEVQQAVIFRIMHDVLNGQVRIKGTVSNEDGITRAFVDIEGYQTEYLDALTQVEEAPKVEEKAEPGVPGIFTPDDTSPIIFGGDAAG